MSNTSDSDDGTYSPAEEDSSDEVGFPNLWNNHQNGGNLLAKLTESESVQKFQTLLKNWDEGRTANGYDPTQTMEEMAEILEKETDAFWCRDPDPFDDRHPSRINSECQLGQVLKTFFKKESFVQDLFNNYLRENYWTRQGSDKNPFVLNCAALRLVLGILPGLEQSVLIETDGLIPRLYQWAIKSPEPMQSYATGLLAVANDLAEFNQEYENKARNDKIVPLMIQRLKGFVRESKETRREAFKRPFSMFSTQSSSSASPAKSPRRMSGDGEPEKCGQQSPDKQAFALGPPLPIIGNNSNSSWVEMESHIIGHFPIHPLTLSAKQVFVLRLLTPLAEYQEFLSVVFEQDLASLVKELIDIKATKDSRLTFEALKFLAALFCHKKFILEWVALGGIQLLTTQIPRPSIAATAVAQCLYFIACDDDSMEKVCLLPRSVLVTMVRYILWCMECSHESSRQFAVMFFGAVSGFPCMLEILDNQDGLRTLYNTIGTLRVLNDDDDSLLMTEDEEFFQRQALRHATVAFRRYFEAHIGNKSDHVRRVHNRSNHSGGNVNVCKPHRFSTQQVAENVETLMELMPLRSRWPPVDNFVELGGIPTCLQMIAKAYDWSFTGRAEMVRSALDVLFICSVMPKVQVIFCDHMELYDDTKTIGINIVLSAAEGDIVQDSADVRRSALNVIINCVCAPISRPGSLTRFLTPTPTSSGAKRKPSMKSSEEIINKLWDCVRSNNGIMILLDLIHTKAPITDADSIRALACRALVGLARSEPAKQIMSKLPIFSNGQLQQLVREPILQDKRAEHVKFQRYAHDLMNMVSAGPGDLKHVAGGNDFSLEMLHRQSVVAQTKISFPKKQLLRLIQEYLTREGLSETASVLQREANLVLMKTPSNKLLLHNRQIGGSTSSAVASTSSQQPRTPANRILSSPPAGGSNPIVRSSTASAAANNDRNSNGNNVSPPPSNHLSMSLNDLPATPTSSHPNPIRFNRLRSTNENHVYNPFSNSNSSNNANSGTPHMKACDPKITNDLYESSVEEPNKVTLVSIVCDYLSSQHSLCKNPMTTCPEFDLFIPHKCPDARPKNSAPLNFCSRLARKSIYAPFGGPEGIKLDRKLIYSRFRPSKALRLDQDGTDNVFTSCAIMPDDSFLLAGTYMGDVKMFNMQTGAEESSYGCHESTINHLQPSRDGKLLLTSSQWRTPYSGLWSLGDFFESKMTFREEEYVEFSKVYQDRIIGTKNEIASIYDIAKGEKIRELKPIVSNNYSRNRATFDPSDDLVLNDGVLYDMRMAKEIRKLDKLNPHLSGVFHPNGMEIISNSEIWDLRTFHLLKTVPGLDQCQVRFSNTGDVIYAISLEQEDEDGEKFESSFKTFDAVDYSNIATIETRRSVLDLCPSMYDLQLAVVENSLSPMVHEDSAVRLYEIGCLKGEEDEEDAEDEENEDDLGGQRDDEDDDDTDMDDDGEFEDLLGPSSGSEGDEDNEDNDEEDEVEDEENETVNEPNEAGDNHEAEREEEEEEHREQNSDDSWEDVEETVSIG